MEDGIEGIVGSVRNLNIADDSLRSRERERRRSTHSHPVSFQNAIHKLVQVTSNVASQAQSVKSLADDANSSGTLSITEACSLYEGIKKLTNVTRNLQTTIDALNEATERSVITHLRSFRNQSGTICKLLSHFDEQIRAIVREVLDHTSGGEVWWKVAEECYNQATRPFGSLDADDYFDPLEEACLESPYDPDIESEEYYEHENRLNVDEDYAAAFEEQVNRRSDARRKDRQSWPEFWITVLNNAPGGPTLFYPPAGLHMESLHLDALPRYLFRTFDEASSGRNDARVIASKASIVGPQESSRTDLLALQQRRATELLHEHLNKSCFSGKGSDNLMSWTSSLLFAVQYAIWRARFRRNIKICIVDTRNFPKGQFAQDLWLLRAYHGTAKQIGGDIEKFFHFRLENKDFYNGEYLSQGKLNHAGRSCVISLDHLLDAGLLQLYPEFGDARGREKWTKRVRELRQNWSAEQGTTDQEIQLAFEVADKCLAEFDSSEIAFILLTFKNRKYLSGLKPTGK